MKKMELFASYPAYFHSYCHYNVTKWLIFLFSADDSKKLVSLGKLFKYTWKILLSSYRKLYG